MKSFLLILLLLLALFLGWDMYLAGHSLPQHTSLTTKDGRTANVEILSCTTDEVRFRLPQNGMVYDWPVNDLKITSRYKVMRLVHSSNKVREEQQRNSPKTIERQRNQQRSSNYVQNLQQQIAEHQRRIAILESRLLEERSRRSSSGSQGRNSSMSMSAEERSISGQIDKLINEIDTYNRRITEEMNSHR